MKFACPDCGQHYEIETVYSGQTIRCVQCNATIAPSSSAAARQPAPPVIQTLQSNIDRGAMTISQFMAQKQLEGGVDLAASESGTGTTASKILTAEQGRKYELGGIVATGGMGAIVDAKDVNLRRDVAKQVLAGKRLRPDGHISGGGALITSRTSIGILIGAPPGPGAADARAAIA